MRSPKSWVSTEVKWGTRILSQSGDNKAVPPASTAQVVSETQTKTVVSCSLQNSSLQNVQISIKIHSSYKGPVQSQTEKRQSIDVNTEITEMLQLFYEDLKGAIIKKLKCAITNMLETNGKQKVSKKK